MRRKIIYFTLLILALTTSACRKTNLKPGIPAFIAIDTMNVVTNYEAQGTSNQKISDVWVYADDQSVGIFEMPAVIPILKEGYGKLTVTPGIKLNGIATSRVPNPFLEPVVFEDFLFIPDSTIQLTGTSKYYESVVFAWMEDFEDVVHSIDTTNKSLAGITVTPEGSDQTFEGSHSGRILLDEEHNLFEGASFDAFVLPTDGSPVLIELNYKNNNMFTVGIFAQSATQIIQDPVIYLNPKENWNKIYINLTSKLQETSSDIIDFKIFFGVVLEENRTEAEILLDNIKLIYR